MIYLGILIFVTIYFIGLSIYFKKLDKKESLFIKKCEETFKDAGLELYKTYLFRFKESNSECLVSFIGFTSIGVEYYIQYSDGNVSKKFLTNPDSLADENIEIHDTDETIAI